MYEAYFIGGPLDLSRWKVSDKRETIHAVDFDFRGSLRINQLGDPSKLQEYKEVIYRIVQISPRGVLIYEVAS